MASTQRRPLIAGNWKMNGSIASGRQLVAALAEKVTADSDAEMLVCPPFVFLDQIHQMLAATPIRLGAQNLCSAEGSGAYTGEVSGEMLVEFGCDFVIVGHSERRTLYGESDAVVTDKFRGAQAAGIVPILCCGETLEEREAGQTAAVVSRQVSAVIDALGIDVFSNAVVAYEPIWAIGTGRTATPDQAQAVHNEIRALISSRDATIASNLRILYGGSVKGSNAAELLGQPDIDGGLVGGASLDAEDFLRIYDAAR